MKPMLMGQWCCVDEYSDIRTIPTLRKFENKARPLLRRAIPLTVSSVVRPGVAILALFLAMPSHQRTSQLLTTAYSAELALATDAAESRANRFWNRLASG